MLKDVDSILGVSTRVLIIKLNKNIFKFLKNHDFSLEYLIISLQWQMYILNVKRIDILHKSAVSVTDYRIHSTLHWIHNTVSRERIGDVNNQIT